MAEIFLRVADERQEKSCLKRLEVVINNKRSKQLLDAPCDNCVLVVLSVDGAAHLIF